MDLTKTIIFWGDDFPNKISASNEKIKLMAKSLIEVGYDVFIVSKTLKEFILNSTEKGNYQGINYICFKKKKGFFILNYFYYFLLVLKELNFLRQIKRNCHSVYLITSYTFFPLLFLYQMYCKIIKIKTIFSIMEWHKALFNAKSILKRLNAILIDEYAVILSSGAIVISDFIFDEFRKKVEPLKLFKLPVLTDINTIDRIKKKENFDFEYFLYCGSIGYIEVIQVVVNSFVLYRKSNPERNENLILILHGKNHEIKNFIERLAISEFSSFIHVYCELSYESLIQYYKEAKALLIPLRNTIQDIARYPQKIAEYTACNKPIISTAVGEIKKDFIDKFNILFSSGFDGTSIANSLKIVSENKSLCEKISENAREKCESYFHYQNYCIPLDNFLQTFKFH